MYDRLASLAKAYGSCRDHGGVTRALDLQEKCQPKWRGSTDLSSDVYEAVEGPLTRDQ